MQQPVITSPLQLEIQTWPIDRLIFYARNPRKNDAAVDRMCSPIREFGFKIPVLALSDGEVVDGHLRLKAARKLGSWRGGDTTRIQRGQKQSAQLPELKPRRGQPCWT